MSIIEINQLSKSYSLGIRKTKKKVALDTVSFSVQEGEVFGVIGPNGAGKSTTLKILMGFIYADSGNVTIQGQTTGTASSRINIGYLPENPSLYGNLTLYEHLIFAGSLTAQKSEELKIHIEELINKVALQDSASIPIKKFSKGMTQRAALAYALVNNPKLLILDEPMSGLDPLGRQLIIDIIKEYHSTGTTILFCSHILTDVERICDRIAIMNKSRLLKIISPDELKNHYKATSKKLAKSPLEDYFLDTIESDTQ